MKKIITILAASIMACAMATTVFAANTEKDEYQAILDKLNEEYSTDVHFASENEVIAYSDSSHMDITPEEFEQYIRKMIIENEIANKEAEEHAQILKTKEICEQGEGICGQPSKIVTRASSTNTRSKKVAGATVYLRATVTNSPGYWMYSSINDVYTGYVAGENSAPAFAASKYNYSLIDAKRTCAINLYGYTVGDYGVKPTNIAIQKGTRNLIRGKSGSGKTTLLSMMAGIEPPTSGKVYFKRMDYYGLNEKKQARIRGENYGFVFQSFHLLPELTVQDNIMVPSMINGGTIDVGFYEGIIRMLGLVDKLESYPSELSGGEQQRTAIARAMIMKPSILFADEPTGNLDRGNSLRIMDMLDQMNDMFGVTIIMVTHDQQLMDGPDNEFHICDGIVTRMEGRNC